MPTHVDPILDVRAEEAFLAAHAPGAVNVPLPELARRTHELPPKGSTIRLFANGASQGAVATDWLRQRGYAVQDAALSPASLTESGPSSQRLWRPSPFLVEALERMASLAPVGGAAPGDGRDSSRAPAPRRALDLACGAGREAVHLALCGWEVDAMDVLPDALEKAADLARRCGVRLRTARQDLRRQPALPKEAHDLVIVFRFLHRPLLPAIAGAIAPGGLLVYETFHCRDAKAGRAPSGASRGAEDGELAAAFAGFEILIARDGAAREGRLFSQLLARKGSRPLA